MTQCCWVSSFQCFKGSLCVHLHSQVIQEESLFSNYLTLRRILYNPLKCKKLSPTDMVSYLRRHESSSLFWVKQILPLFPTIVCRLLALIFFLFFICEFSFTKYLLRDFLSVYSILTWPIQKCYVPFRCLCFPWSCYTICLAVSFLSFQHDLLYIQTFSFAFTFRMWKMCNIIYASI